VSLRARLLVITLAMVAVALSGAGWATHQALRSFLVDRVDDELTDARLSAVRLSIDPGGPERAGPGGRLPPSALPAGSVVEIRDADGSVVGGFQVRSTSTPALDVPAAIPEGYSDVDVSGAGEYRVLAVADGSPPEAGLPPGVLPADGSLVIAIPLADVNDTLGRLLWIELAVGGATLAALGALAWWLVRLGLRPMERIGATADAIAAGDLSQRVEDENPRTEIGRLGRTLNVMLTRIEESFAERRESERRLRQFVGDASHELQTPLTSVRGYAELFRRGAAERPADLETAMRRIEEEAERMGVLVDDLLLLARLDQGRPLERRRTDLGALVEDLVTDARVVEPDRPIDVAADGPVVVWGDDVRLRQVVGNLLSNARAHTPRGAPVAVRVRVEGGEAVVEVDDSGPGLAPEHAERVFERFFRADPSRARASGGSGLGLSIVSAIAEAHGGRAEVHSTPGRGATFRVVFPLAPRLPADPQTEPTPV
jgi:two-component system OmpR family sensor kinase